jgi:hypothetical protein
MALPSATREQMLAAFAQFDNEFKNQPEFANWRENKSYKYAIRYNDQLYPMKSIIELATGQPAESFSGGSEALTFVKKLGFAGEPIRLPTEREVGIALHELLLLRHPAVLDPADAYETLAETFGLSKTLRALPMEGSEINHWENRVQWARKRLVDEGVIDNSEHGVWQLKKRTSPIWWIEKSLVAGRPDREAGDNAFGNALWSPTRSQDGRDIYRNMRLVQPGDHIIHLIDNQRIVGASISEAFARPDFVGLPNTDWSGMQS